jgi:hypothetical protein
MGTPTMQHGDRPEQVGTWTYQCLGWDTTTPDFGYVDVGTTEQGYLIVTIQPDGTGPDTWTITAESYDPDDESDNGAPLYRSEDPTDFEGFDTHTIRSEDLYDFLLNTHTV